MDNNVDPPTARIRNVRLARRGRQGARNRDHIKGPRARAGRFGRFCTRSRRRSCAVPGASPAGRDRHPGVGTLVGPAGACGPPAVDPWTKLWRPARRDGRATIEPMPDPRRPDPTQPTSPRASTPSRRPSAPGPSLVPEVGIVLGSGLGGLADDLEDAVAIPFAELPGWPAATAPGHVGRLLLGRLGRPAGRACSRAASTCTRATLRASSSSRSCCSRRLGAQVRRPHERRRRPRPVVRARARSWSSATTSTSPGQNPLIGPNADAHRGALPGHDRCLEPAPARAPARGRRRRGRRARRGRVRRADRAELRDPGRGPAVRRARAATPSACRRSWSASPRAGPASRCAGSRW